MKRPKVSIIVPVYNVEKYLEECLTSLLGQTLASIEVILIDDGSTDESGKIIDRFAQQDSRIVVLHQSNAGYGATVNRGIAKARGEYIGIIEPDDFVEPDMYEQLYNGAVKCRADVVKGMFYKYNSTLPQGQQDQLFVNPSGVDLRLAPDEAFKITEWPTLLAFHASIWSAIYRADFVKKIKLQETSGASYQDLPFMFETLTQAERILVVKKAFVHWRNDPDQVHSTSNTGVKALKMIESCQTGVEIIQRSGDYETLKEALAIHLVWTNVGFFEAVDKQVRKHYFQDLRALLMPFDKDKTFQYRYFRLVDKIFFKLAVKNNWLLMNLGLHCLNLHKRLKHR